MSNKRIPLSNISNAANSPIRAVTAAAKRARSQSNFQRSGVTNLQFQEKADLSENYQERLKSPKSHQQPSQPSEGHIFAKGANGSQPTPFERRLLASREKAGQRNAPRQERPTIESLENIRQWQKHYRKAFPAFVFYFEGIPDEARTKFSKQIHLLGAREERFFSKDITHVVTTRTLPRVHDIHNSTETSGTSSNGGDAAVQPKTINPLLLEKPSEAASLAGLSTVPRSQFTFEARLGKAAGHSNMESDSRKAQNDVLSQAKSMGMKIWALEKLQRIMSTMFNTDTGAQPPHSHNTRSHTTEVRAGHDDLSQLLRHERLYGPSDRDFSVAPRDLILFKGPFIYIHDMNEKTRPVLVREYPKVANREEGTWPQFRSVTEGRCPFVEEPVSRRASREAAKEKERRRLKRETEATNRLRGSTKLNMQPPAAVTGKRALAEMEHGSISSIPFVGNAAEKSRRRLPWNKILNTQDKASNDAPGSCAFKGPAPVRMCGGEPVASGMQQSNITSAIRSQMISSTAAAPGAKAGMSKEVYELKRKVLEKNSAEPPSRVSTSHRKNEPGSASTMRTDLTTESTHGTVQNSRRLVSIGECGMSAEDEDEDRPLRAPRKERLTVKKVIQRDPKPGYCENCREKFDDFEPHILSRRHRRFAATQDNWSELDSLLSNLVRPLRRY
ncbi:MAG: hypothetical protein M1814_004777 [Vezdaea aestivalis]|nr:MAG: hypothetical protein M1814_004777 [Vezdaea aestivalis]